jgi:putative salt-induced outer membrane protein YdiY
MNCNSICRMVKTKISISQTQHAIAALLLICSLAFTCAADTVHADELILTNGERLIGTLITMEDGTINFESDMLGTIKVPLNKVRRLSVENPQDLHTADDKVLSFSAVEIADETGRIEAPGSGLTQLIRLEEITAINPPVQPKIKFSGNIASGLVDTHGSSSSTKANMSADLTIRTERQRLTLDTRWFYGREKERTTGAGSRYIETDKNYTAGARYDYFLTKKFYGYIGIRYKRDSVADLKYRLVNSTGLGYQWFETTAFKFSTDAGIAQYKEKYVSRVNNPVYVPGGTQPKTLKKTRRVDDLAWQTGMALDWRVNSRLALLSQIRHTQSFEDSRDYYLSTETELRLFLTKSFYSNLKTIFEYDNTPGADSNSTESKHIFGLGWSF